MPDFYEVLRDEYEKIKGGDGQLDLSVVLEFHFDSKVVRLWAGIDDLVGTNGESYQGFLFPSDTDGEYNTAVQLPDRIDDLRAGTSPLYNFSLGYIDDEHYELLRAEDEDIDGRLVIIGFVYVPPGTARASTEMGHVSRLRMRGIASWSEKFERGSEGELVRKRIVSVGAKNLNGGRSQTYDVSMTDTNQRWRSKDLYDIDDDEYCQFVGLIAQGLKIEF